MKKILPVAAVLCCLFSQTAAAEDKQILTVMSHESFNVTRELVTDFEKKNNVTVRFLKGGDGGSMLVQAILSRENPLADVIFGIDNTFFSRAIKGDILEPYQSPLLSMVAKELQLDPQYRLLPVDYGDVCLNYDKKWFTSRSIEPPAQLEDLVKPAYKGLLVVENPATSSPGLAFLLATIGHFGDGDDGYLHFWEQLKKNDVLIADGWSDAYYNHFTAASKGDRPIVVSYASSPAAAVYYAEEKGGEAPTAAVIGNRSAFRQIEFVGILKGTKNRALAEKFIDFMLSRTFQEDIPLQMFVFPVNKTAQLPDVFKKHAILAEETLPDVFKKHAILAEETAVVDPATIEQNREAWLAAWSNLMLH
ncbi:MAG: thiamine ABC transporter substrate-binding protein [Desulfobacterales bacterium]|nr:MAG: thiamine ABC transporter substrate-binding protein [Desulfobacterales bacterium]